MSLVRIFIGTRKSDGGREVVKSNGYGAYDTSEYSEITGPYTSERMALDVIERKRKKELEVA